MALRVQQVYKAPHDLLESRGQQELRDQPESLVLLVLLAYRVQQASRVPLGRRVQQGHREQPELPDCKVQPVLRDRRAQRAQQGQSALPDQRELRDRLELLELLELLEPQVPSDPQVFKVLLDPLGRLAQQAPQVLASLVLRAQQELLLPLASMPQTFSQLQREKSPQTMPLTTRLFFGMTVQAS